MAWGVLDAAGREALVRDYMSIYPDREPRGSVDLASDTPPLFVDQQGRGWNLAGDRASVPLVVTIHPGGFRDRAPLFLAGAALALAIIVGG